MPLRGGVIIIGSLLWDNSNRQKWRENDLCFENRFKVYIPIRYGRYSCTRKIYTMVFSNNCYLRRYGLGTGWVLPIKTKINSFSELKGEAKKMGETEGFNNGFSSDWGSVALLFNPNKIIDDSIKEEWGKFMSDKIPRPPLSVSEKFPIDFNGFLTIRWPEEVMQKNKIEKYDFLIATVTNPTLINNRYPTVYKIANAMEKVDDYLYFEKNREYEITTFQDERIPQQELGASFNHKRKTSLSPSGCRYISRQESGVLCGSIISETKRKRETTKEDS